MLVEADPGNDRVEVTEEGIDRAQERRELVAEELAQGGEGLGGLFDNRFEAFEEALGLGGELGRLISVGESCSATGMSCWIVGVASSRRT